MRWHWEYRWHPGVTPDLARRRIVETYDADGGLASKLAGWYGYAGEAAGFLLIDEADPFLLNQLLSSLSDVMAFEVRAAFELKPEPAIARRRGLLAGAAAEGGA